MVFKMDFLNKRMIIKLNKKRIKINNLKKVSEMGKFIGLMFKKSNTKNLLFSFKKDLKMAIHSYFVFFDFLAIWVDGKNNVLEFKIIRPFTSIIKPRKEFRKLIEIPFNSENSRILRFFVGKRKI
jgi:uncharacterized membrane protein (UPF0127 family)